MAKFSDSHSWIFRGFPELDPDAILRQRPGNDGLATEEEKQRAWWLWERRPRGMNVLVYGLLLGIGLVGVLQNLFGQGRLLMEHKQLV